MSKLETKQADTFYAVARVAAGALFFMLGCMKLFGLWGMPGGPAVFNTLIWYAGASEFLIGLSLVTGVWVRLASFFGFIEMVVAYYVGHVAMGGWNPAVNMGVPAVMYALFFLVTFAYGAKKWSLERKVFKKELF